MELLVKLYQDKNPRIGVVYPSEFQAGKAFEQILEKHGHENFKAFLELKRHYLQLTLMPLNGGANVVYKELSFKPEHIKKLQAFIKPGTEMHFVHVFKKGSESFIAKVRFKHPQPLIISTYEISEISFQGR
jgi:hypothetical protein